jgi:hypothetical protein
MGDPGRRGFVRPRREKSSASKPAGPGPRSPLLPAASGAKEPSRAHRPRGPRVWSRRRSRRSQSRNAARASLQHRASRRASSTSLSTHRDRWLLMTDRRRATLHLRISTTRQTQIESAGRVGHDCASSPNMPSQSLRRWTMIAERRRMIERACDADHPNVARSFSRSAATPPCAGAPCNSARAPPATMSDVETKPSSANGPRRGQS